MLKTMERGGGGARAESAADARRSRSFGDAEVNRNKPILVVDDNDSDVDLTVLAFKQAKLANPIQVARDAEEALAWIPRWEAGEAKPVVILLDINMPKVSGLEVLQALKKRPSLRSIPVVVLTTSSMKEDVRNAYAHGANSYIVKPVDFDGFMEVAKQIELYWAGLNQVIEE